ncbi:MAG: hypothetical protein JOY60_16795 [Burkholderiaceae bacterium]|nr:hypothetical protein [Roseateles sp.]MBV8471512.1 hypothetical protein [Burkholderiaceae bacterium]
MQVDALVLNPFLMMLDPEQVAREAACSDRLNRLQRRVCRPLDKPLIPKAAELAAFDREIDEAQIEAELDECLDEVSGAADVVGH